MRRWRISHRGRSTSSTSFSYITVVQGRWSVGNGNVVAVHGGNWRAYTCFLAARRRQAARTIPCSLPRPALPRSLPAAGRRLDDSRWTFGALGKATSSWGLRVSDLERSWKRTTRIHPAVDCPAAGAWRTARIKKTAPHLDRTLVQSGSRWPTAATIGHSSCSACRRS